MAAAMREHKRESYYMVLPGDGHDLLNPANRLRLAEATEAFLARVLGGRLEPPASDEGLKPFVR